MREELKEKEEVVKEEKLPTAQTEIKVLVNLQDSRK